MKSKAANIPINVKLSADEECQNECICSGFKSLTNSIDSFGFLLVNYGENFPMQRQFCGKVGKLQISIGRKFPWLYSVHLKFIRE